MTSVGAGITIVGASAGSGKTHRLTEEITRRVTTSSDIGVDVESLVAVTFTRKAHAELEARIREALARSGAHETALRLPLAYIGTVHAVALRLLQELALDAGLSPNVDVVAGNETKLLRQSFERSLDEGRRDRLDELAARLELRSDRTGRNDWVSPCADIMALARANRIAPAGLPAMAERSLLRLLRLLPPPTTDGTTLDDALRRALDGGISRLRASGDETVGTAKALATLEDIARRARDAELRWSDWVKASAIAPSVRSAPHVSEIRKAAARYESHPRLHDDLRAMTTAIFEAAEAGLVAYQDWKRERRVVDYVDMLDGALTLVDAPRVREELSRRLRFVVVDEFQDTSPIQLALFMRLHALAGQSIWVGDPKQCIFEYAGADPVLMDAVTSWVGREGGAEERLSHNYRSRPALVNLCSELFAAAFAEHGFAREDVVVEAHRAEREELALLPPLGVWSLAAENAAEDAEAVAEGIRRMLDAPHETPVLDRATGNVRPLRPGDVAVLAATNDWAGLVAGGLHARGLRVAIARAGLFETPEGTLVDAALRWLVDAHDGLAAAVIDALEGWAGVDAETWLADRIRAASRTVRDGDERAPESLWQLALGAVRKRLGELSPMETVDATIAALDLVQLCARWPDAAQRIVNIDAIRAVAQAYEKRCGQEREAATVAGLLRYFDDIRTPTMQRDEILPADDQHVPVDDDAVVICTYHKSKGLEWPVVVLGQLDRGERRSAFAVTPETREATGFDPENPLAHRAIRYWPWPFGRMTTAPLADRAEASDEGRAIALRERRERARLLYVGFTRARDHLVLATRINKGKTKSAWLDVLCAGGEPLLLLPTNAVDGAIEEIGVRGTAVMVPTRVYRLSPSRSVRDDVEPRAPRWFARPLGAAVPPERYPFRIVPSSEIEGWPAHAQLVAGASIGNIEPFSAGITLGREPEGWDILGNAVHGFFAADVEDLTTTERMACASRLIEGWRVQQSLRPESLLEAGDRLRRWVARRWPSARWHREIPIEGAVPTEHGERWLSGIIDLLIDTGDGVVIVDHKSYPVRSVGAWATKCTTFIPQLAAYALLLRQGGWTVREAWIHFPVGGGAVECRFQ